MNHIYTYLGFQPNTISQMESTKRNHPPKVKEQSKLLTLSPASLKQKLKS